MQPLSLIAAGVVTCLACQWLVRRIRSGGTPQFSVGESQTAAVLRTEVLGPPAATEVTSEPPAMTLPLRSPADLAVAGSSSDLEARRGLVQLAAWAVEGGASDEATHAGGILIDARSVDAAEFAAIQESASSATPTGQEAGANRPSRSPIAASHYRALADELGYATDSIAVQSNRLVESYGDSAQFSFRSQDLWSAVEKLQRFRRKLRGLGTDSAPRLAPVAIEPVLRWLQRHAESSGTFRVSLETGQVLPKVLADESQLRDGLSFLVDALGHTDTADQLEITATSNADDMRSVCLEFMIDCPTRSTSADAESTSQPDEAELDFHTAEILLQGTGAVVTVENQPGFRTCVSVDLPAQNSQEADLATESDIDAPVLEGLAQAEDDVVIPLMRPPQPIIVAAEPDEDTVPPTATHHAFGGTLVLDRDPAIRNMIASELRALEDRPVMTCADGEAAKALLEATPERFELLVLERNARLVSGESLAMQSLNKNPSVKVILLTRRANNLATDPAWDDLMRDPAIATRVDTLQKPPATATLQTALKRMIGPCRSVGARSKSKQSSLPPDIFLAPDHGAVAPD